MENPQFVDPSAWELEPDLASQIETMQPLDQDHEAVRMLKNAIRIFDFLLEAATRHNWYDRLKIAYYALATYYVGRVDPFPALVLYGPPSTGKTTTISIMASVVARPVRITGETITDAALRQSMNDALLGTLIIEEADKISLAEMENILTTRSSRASGQNTKMVPVGRNWRKSNFQTYGATVLHRRVLFRSPALLRRIIAIQTKRMGGKDDEQIASNDHRLKAIGRLAEVHVKLPTLKNLWNIESGIFDYYYPLLALAVVAENIPFIELLLLEMGSRSNELREEETYLEPATLLKMFVAMTSSYLEMHPHLQWAEHIDKRLNFELRQITPMLREEFGPDCSVLKLSSNQRNRIIREDIGFTVKASGGRQRVHFTIPQLIKACEGHSVKDEAIERWKEAMKGQKRQES